MRFYMPYCLLSFFLLCVPIHASSQERIESRIDSVKVLSDTVTQPRKGFKAALTRFIRSLNNYDKSYISPNRFDFTTMVTYYSNFEYFTVGSSEPKSQSLMFSPTPHYKVGLYLGWKWIFLGITKDVRGLLTHTQKTRGTEIDLSLYASHIGADIFYRSTGNDYYIHRAIGFSDDIKPEYSTDFTGLHVYMKGINLYYIFNHRHFSYPAAFSQSTNQRRSAGSLIAGFSVSKHRLNFDYTKLPEVIQQDMNEGMKVQNIKYTNTSLSVGYAYNWVFARNCLACISVTPALAYKTSNINAEGVEESRQYHNLTLDILFRTGVVYNNSKYYVGTSFIGKNYHYHRDDFSVNNGFGFLQVYAGINFDLFKSKKWDTFKNNLKRKK